MKLSTKGQYGTRAMLELALNYLNDPKSCSRVKSCVTRDIWEKMKEAIVGVLESTTLEDLVEQQRQKQL